MAERINCILLSMGQLLCVENSFMGDRQRYLKYPVIWRPGLMDRLCLSGNLIDVVEKELMAFVRVVS